MLENNYNKVGPTNLIISHGNKQIIEAYVKILNL